MDSAARATRFEGLRNVDPALWAPLRRLVALSQASRLELFRLLVAAGPTGMTHEELAETLRLRNTAITLHLRILAEAGLIELDPEERVLGDASLNRRSELRCYSRPEAFRDVAEFILSGSAN